MKLFGDDDRPDWEKMSNDGMIMGMKVASSIFAMGMVAGMGALAMCKNSKLKKTENKGSDS